ncbi:hypothetical protein DPMN_031701 [Dreissena polymorpha]|uniref:Uncharacterized protein n=1 Tax=Dreissena polymorpha TaxID=45954 RepID=A0A9D4M0G2_DREPO|nr:hypothetical protein DPMN_031701 [Dreissena polymorpha]
MSLLTFFRCPIQDVRLRSVPTAFPLLKQSACLGNMDAMYTAAVILNNGIHVKADDIQVF